MKTFLNFAAYVAFTAAAFGGTIDISTGVANWQVSGPGIVVPIAATSVLPNGTWAPPPAGSTWVSFNADQSTSCVVGQTPGNGCANPLVNAGSDNWTYALNVSAATLGVTSGDLNFIFGADDQVILAVGNGGPSQFWNPGGNAFSPLGCSGTPPTSAGNTQATYNTCVGTVSFNAANLNVDGSLTLTAIVTNAPVIGCPNCGDPTGFVLEGAINTGAAAAAPEPATFALVGLAGLAGLALRRRN